MLKHRLISATILVPTVITILFLLPLLEFKILTLLTCMLSAWEWGKLSRLSSNAQKIWLLLIFILLLTIFQVSAHQLFFNSNYNQCIACIVLIWWTIALLLILFYPNSAKLWNKFTIVWTIFGTLIILPFFWGILILKNYDYNKDTYTGAWTLLYIIILVWGMDSFSYIIGRTLGQHQATPRLSPYKTWEGYIGGILVMIVIFLLFYKYIPTNLIKYSKLFPYSIIIILSSVLGDLTESMFKRESGVKDSSQLIPGHGGVLDAIDSLCSTIPIFTSLMILIR